MKQIISNKMSFSLEDIIIADIMDRDTYLDTEHTKNAVSKSYTIKKDNKIEKIILFDEYIGSNYSGKYFLQDLAYQYKIKHSNSNDLLMFVEKNPLKSGVDAYTLFAITSYDCFNENLVVKIEFELNSNEEITTVVKNKLKNILNNGDFSCDALVIISNQKIEIIEKLIKDENLRIQSENIRYMSTKEISSLFKSSTPFQKGNALQVFIGLGLLCFSFFDFSNQHIFCN